MIKTHKTKIYPNATMRKVLNSLFNYRRCCYNQALETWNMMYDESLILDDNSFRPNERKVRDELVDNKQDWQFLQSARVLQLAVNDLAKGWKNYFNPKMPNHAKPRFKSKKRSKRVFKTDRAKVVNGRLRLDKPRGSGAWYDIKLAEKLRWQGDIKLVTVVEEVDGYYACLSIDVADIAVEKHGVQVTGVDANIARFDYKDAYGYQQVNSLPQSLPCLYQRITVYQRLLARKRVANPKSFQSNNYRTTRTKLKRDYQKVKRIQEDLLKKFTAKLVDENDVVAIEDLDVLHMKMNKRLGKNLHRSMFGKFKQMMAYKSKWNGVKLVLVDQFYPSTQRCSQCGYIKTGDEKIGLSGNQKHYTGHDEYVCYHCGAKMLRDENAVENLIQYTQVK
ncbi:RNA-guided endonuclease InsQ/TnpB family protein [Lacticaseibacillus baoqingensis]|uniref:RNA-guided endonuclease InsQ/TnpB family protein n=1 Tax=Lacticaseibacillus baoqingensis TaxID=2486013 RepID=A0ABW4E728_9LACO|nr:RNA-guided endonuclease TnpB family protein [Lacticaseibacillus baoqingensis]